MLHIIGKKLKKVCLLHWNLIVFTVCMGWYMIDCVEETKKLGVLKKKTGVLPVRKTVVYHVNQAKTMALNMLT